MPNGILFRIYNMNMRVTSPDPHPLLPYAHANAHNLTVTHKPRVCSTFLGSHTRSGRLSLPQGQMDLLFVKEAAYVHVTTLHVIIMCVMVHKKFVGLMLQLYIH